jgi:hypothetical protein
MKNYLIIALVSISSQSFSQEIEKEIYINEVKCNSINFDSKSQLFEYIGSVSFKTEIIEFKNVYGIGEFCIDGSIQMSEKATMRKLRYKIGDKIAYIE